MKVKNYLFLIIATLVSAACIILALPHETESFPYDYKQGQPWNYEQKIAPYAFPIMKSEKQLKHEQDSVLKEVAPYCKFDSELGSKQIERFRSDASQHGYVDVPLSYVLHVRQLLIEVYTAGIMDPNEYNTAIGDGTKTLRFVDGAIATSRDVANIYSTRTAYEYIMGADADHFTRATLAQLHVDDYLVPNVLIDDEKTSIARKEARESVSPSSGMIQAGERIIDRGEIVTAHKYDILESMKAESLLKGEKEKKSLLPIIVGQSGLVIILFCLMLAYVLLFRRYIFNNLRSMLFLYSTITFFSVASCLFVKFHFYSVYLIPFAMAPVFVRIFLDSRTAIMAHFTLVIIASIPLHTNYQFIITEFLGGVVAIYSVRELTQRSQLFQTALLATGMTMLSGFCLFLLSGTALRELDRSWFFYIALNGVALLFAYPLLYLMERLYGFTSSVTLIELSNINAPIFRRMAKEAQGTFVHSMQVGNLAAEVAAKIGAKVQLVRTGAMYHDIGKMKNPAFFTENQTSVNPHDALEEERSASIIINHVTDGLKVAEKYNLPSVIRDFIVTHHGTSMVKYFYIQACNKHGEENVDKRAFTYPGKNPATREQAILMMADAIEAASRSLKEYTEESLTRLVDGIVDGQVAAGCYKECAITFRDISEAKRVFIDSLKTIYHTRIAYPEMGKKEEEQKPAAAEPQQQPAQRLFGSNAWSWRKN